MKIKITRSYRITLCRHRITGDDWQLLGVQQRYYPHFAPFLNARIARLRQEQG